jgi:hypothetical protein
MAHFAKLHSDNTVVQVIVVNNDVLKDENGIEQEQLGIDFCSNLFGGNWMQCSYNGSIRKNFPSVGYSYSPERNAFIEPKPFASWILNEDICRWEAPTPKPEGGYGFHYNWDEESVLWKKIEIDYSTIE